MNRMEQSTRNLSISDSTRSPPHHPHPSKTPPAPYPILSPTPPKNHPKQSDRKRMRRVSPATIAPTKSEPPPEWRRLLGPARGGCRPTLLYQASLLLNHYKLGRVEGAYGLQDIARPVSILPFVRAARPGWKATRYLGAPGGYYTPRGRVGV